MYRWSQMQVFNKKELTCLGRIYKPLHVDKILHNYYVFLNWTLHNYGKVNNLCTCLRRDAGSFARYVTLNVYAMCPNNWCTFSIKQKKILAYVIQNKKNTPFSHTIPQTFGTSGNRYFKM